MSTRWLAGVAVCGAIALAALLKPSPETLALEYQSGTEPHPAVGGLGGRTLDTSADRPAGLALPDLQSTSPLFARWTSPRVPGGLLWLALDAAQEAGVYDRLYIDANGNGRLDDDAAIEALSARDAFSYFTPVPVSWRENGRAVTYHLNFILTRAEGRPRLAVRSSGWFAGAVTVRGKEKECALIDQNANATFNDRSIDLENADMIQIVEPGVQDVALVGEFVEVDARLYRLEVPREGGRAILTPAKGVRFGKVQQPTDMVELIAGGENGMFTVKLRKGAGKLPAGRYRIYQWTQQRKDSYDNEWAIIGHSQGNPDVFEIAAGRPVRPDLGEPITSRMEVQAQEERQYVLRHAWHGRAGESVRITCNGASPPPAQVHIRNADGSYDRIFTFEHG